MIAGAGRVGGRPVYVWAQNVKHKGGSLGQGGGETIVSTIQAADKAGAPVVGFLHSGGARLQEGVAALGAYAAIFRATSRAMVPQISVICGPVRGRRRVLAVARHARDDGRRRLADVPHRPTRHRARDARDRRPAADLGGPRVHRKSGVSHLVADDDAEASDLIRAALTYFPGRIGGPPVRDRSGRPARGRSGGDGADQPAQGLRRARRRTPFRWTAATSSSSASATRRTWSSGSGASRAIRSA